MLLCALNIGIHAVDKRLDDLGSVRVVPIQFLRKIASIHKEAIADVAVEFLGAKHFGDSAGHLTAPELQLKKPIAGGVVSLSEKESFSFCA